jgi:hypothetical protein
LAYAADKPCIVRHCGPLDLETLGGTFMRNERGNVIAVVLLILAVVSLVGAGALMMSRYDLRFTAAMRSYDKGFNLADGGATIGFRYVSTPDPETYYLTSDDKSSVTSTYKDTPPSPHTVSCHCLDVTCCQKAPYNCSKETLKTKSTCTRCVDRAAGEYDSRIQFIEYDTGMLPGFDPEVVGSVQYWTGLGVSERAPGAKGTYKTANSVVQVSALKLMPK